MFRFRIGRDSEQWVACRTIASTLNDPVAIAQARDFTVRRLMVGTARTNGRVILRLALHFAHRAFCAAAILLRAEADIVLLRVVIETTFRPFTFAHLAR